MGEAEVNYDARLFRRELRVAIQEAIEIARPTRRSKIGMGASKQRHGHRDDLMKHSWLLAPTDADSADEEFPVSGSQTIVSPTPILTSMSRASDSATTAGGTVTEPEGSAVMKKPTETGYFGSIGSTFAEALEGAQSKRLSLPRARAHSPDHACTRASAGLSRPLPVAASLADGWKGSFRTPFTPPPKAAPTNSPLLPFLPPDALRSWTSMSQSWRTSSRRIWCSCAS